MDLQRPNRWRGADTKTNAGAFCRKLKNKTVDPVVSQIGDEWRSSLLSGRTGRGKIACRAGRCCQRNSPALPENKTAISAVKTSLRGWRRFINGASEWNRTTDLGLMSPTL